MSMLGEEIRDFSGTIRGWVETKPNGDQVVRNFSGAIVSKYYADTNETVEFTGARIAKGNVAVSKLYY